MKTRLLSVGVIAAALVLVLTGSSFAFSWPFAVIGTIDELNVTKPGNDEKLPDGDVTFSGTAEAGSSISISVGTREVGAGKADTGGDWNITVPNNAMAGVKDVQVNSTPARSDGVYGIQLVDNVSVVPDRLAWARTPEMGCSAISAQYIGAHGSDAIPGATVTMVLSKPNGDDLYRASTTVAGGEHAGTWQIDLGKGRLAELLAAADLSEKSITRSLYISVDGLTSAAATGTSNCGDGAGFVGITSPSPGTTLTDPRTSFSGTASNVGTDARISYTLREKATGDKYGIGTGKWTRKGSFVLHPSRDLPYGQFDLIGTFTLADGSIITDQALGYRLILEPPTVANINNVLINGRIVGGTGKPGATVNVALRAGDATIPLSTVVEDDGKWILTVPTSVKAGTYKVSANQSVPGATSLSTPEYTFTVEDGPVGPGSPWWEAWIQWLIRLILEIIGWLVP